MNLQLSGGLTLTGWFGVVNDLVIVNDFNDVVRWVVVGWVAVFAPSAEPEYDFAAHCALSRAA